MSETTELSVPETLSLDSQPPEPDTELDTRERPLTPREQMMARIVQRAQEQREHEEDLGATYEREARERGESWTTEEEPPETPPEAPEAPPAAAAPEPPPPAPAAPEPPQAPALRQIMLNGQAWSVTPEQYDQLAQVGALATVAMAQPPAVPPEPAPRRPIVDDGRLSETVQKIQFGSPDEAKAALAGLIEHVVGSVPAPQQIDPNQLVATAVQRTQQVARAEREAEIIRSEYPKIFADPKLAQDAHAWVAALETRDRQLGRQRSTLDVYREAGNLVYGQIGEPRPGSEVSTPTASQAAPIVQPRAGVEERKRAAPRNPQPVDRRAAQPEAPRPPTGSDIVAKMRQDRGQASLR